jgi:hypothetical protein
VRTKLRKKIARRTRVPMVQASQPNENGRWILSRHGCSAAAGFVS